MTNRELADRYRNLLISLCQYHQGMINRASRMAEASQIEETLGRRLGLRAKVKTIYSQAWLLQVIIHRNKAALKFFFQRTDIESIASEQILLTERQRGVVSEEICETKHQHPPD